MSGTAARIDVVRWFEEGGDSWDIRQAGGSPCQRGAPALQEELPVIDYSGSSRGGAEQGSPGGTRVVLGHQRGVVDGDPPGGDRDIHTPHTLCVVLRFGRHRSKSLL